MISEGKEDETATASSHAKNKCLHLLILVTMSLNSIFQRKNQISVSAPIRCDRLRLCLGGQNGITSGFCGTNKAAWVYRFHSGEVDAQKRWLHRKGTPTGSCGTSR